MNNVENADKIFHNGKIYTVDSNFSMAEAMAVKGDTILATGEDDAIMSRYQSDTLIDLQGKPVYPGFIDAHCHFYHYGLGLRQVGLKGCQSFEEVLDSLKRAEEALAKDEWLRGKGWDQNDWPSKEFPDKTRLDSLFPERPVFLTRIDGHAALVNQKALDIAGIDSTATVEGGQIEKKGGQPTGILVDNAVDLVEKHIPEPDSAQRHEALMKAQKNCFEVGLTTVSDAAMDRNWVETVKKAQASGRLKIRIYGMLNANNENFEAYIKDGVYRSDRLHLGAIKLFADGALGSRGACLLAPYHDESDEQGFLLHDTGHFKKWAQIAYENGYQLNTHAIGDSACRTMLTIYSDYLEPGNSKRWRIEHAQVVHPDDMGTFGEYNIIPSVQPSHATSDMKWADERLGPDRIKNAYAYQDLMRQNGLVALGSDFPVEEINPLLQFYTAVARKNKKGDPKGGFQPENGLSRKQALKGLTRWAAYANFEEDQKGSLEAGKLADFVVLEKDIMEISVKEILSVEVVNTYLGGKVVK